jgi:NAD(P)-dependent dehydrogenase (short-subunit alcohol dehydrogenase family)
MLKDKVVVVTGGAGLLGRAFVRGIVEHGGTAIVADINLANATRVAEDLATHHSKHVIPARLDITDTASIDGLIGEMQKKCGRIDAVLNNAYPRNPAYGQKLEDVTYADFCENVNSHLGGYFLVSQRFARFFCGKGGGNIVNMGSVYGTLAPRFEVYDDTTMTMPVEYAAIKSGVIQLTRYFAKYYRREGIRVNCVSPGGIFDNQPEPLVRRYTALAGTKGMLSPEDIVGAVVYMLSDDSKYVTGQNLVVDDAFSL